MPSLSRNSAPQPVRCLFNQRQQLTVVVSSVSNVRRSDEEPVAFGLGWINRRDHRLGIVSSLDPVPSLLQLGIPIGKVHPHRSPIVCEPLDNCTDLPARLNCSGQRKGKELLGSETAWGAEVDDKRVEVMRHTLGDYRNEALSLPFIRCSIAWSAICTIGNTGR